MKNILLIITCFLSLNAFSQVEDGSIATDFTLTDWYGNTHNLYSYLDDDKTVFLEIFAAHCPGCWSYHQTHRMKNMYETYGPEASGEIMVLALEHDQYNGENAFTGIGDVWNTAGNWLEGTPYPQFNVEGGNRSVFDDYNVTFYPVIYKICPDGVVERVSTSLSEDQLYEKVEECQFLSVEDSRKEELKVSFDQSSRTVNLIHSEASFSLEILNLQGQVVKSISSFSESVIDVSDLSNGVYIFQFKIGSETKVEKLSVY